RTPRSRAPTASGDRGGCWRSWSCTGGPWPRAPRAASASWRRCPGRRAGGHERAYPKWANPRAPPRPRAFAEGTGVLSGGGLPEPMLDQPFDALPQRRLLDGVQNLRGERVGEEAPRRVAVEPARAQVEQRLVVEPAHRRAMRTLDVVGENFQ